MACNEKRGEKQARAADQRSCRGRQTSVVSARSRAGKAGTKAMHRVSHARPPIALLVSPRVPHTQSHAPPCVGHLWDATLKSGTHAASRNMHASPQGMLARHVDAVLPRKSTRSRPRHCQPLPSEAAGAGTRRVSRAMVEALSGRRKARDGAPQRWRRAALKSVPQHRGNAREAKWLRLGVRPGSGDHTLGGSTRA